MKWSLDSIGALAASRVCALADREEAASKVKMGRRVEWVLLMECFGRRKQASAFGQMAGGGRALLPSPTPLSLLPQSDTEPCQFLPLFCSFLLPMKTDEPSSVFRSLALFLTSVVAAPAAPAAIQSPICLSAVRRAVLLEASRPNLWLSGPPSPVPLRSVSFFPLPVAVVVAHVVTCMCERGYPEVRGRSALRHSCMNVCMYSL